MVDIGHRRQSRTVLRATDTAAAIARTEAPPLNLNRKISLTRRIGSLRTAKRTLAGCEAMALVRKGQVHNVGGRDMKAQTTFVAGLFGAAA